MKYQQEPEQLSKTKTQNRNKPNKKQNKTTNLTIQACDLCQVELPGLSTRATGLRGASGGTPSPRSQQFRGVGTEKPFGLFQ